MMTFDEVVQRTIKHIDFIASTDEEFDYANDIVFNEDNFLYFILDNEYTPDGDETLSEYIDRVFIEVNKHYNP